MEALQGVAHDSLVSALGVGAGEVVGLVGAGGKTTAMYRLAGELAGRGRRVLTAKSTVVIRGTVERSPCVLCVGSLEELLGRLPGALAAHGQAMVVTGEVREGLFQGIEADWACAVVGRGVADCAVVEADGARHRWLKAPAAHEPSLPACTTLLCPVASAQGFGQPLGAQSAHRPEIVAALTGAPEGAPITPEIVAALLVHPLGGLKGTPARARVAPILAAVAPTSAQPARRTAQLLLAHPRVELVVLHWRTPEGLPGLVEEVRRAG